MFRSVSSLLKLIRDLASSYLDIRRKVASLHLISTMTNAVPSPSKQNSYVDLRCAYAPLPFGSPRSVNDVFTRSAFYSLVSIMVRATVVPGCQNQNISPFALSNELLPTSDDMALLFKVTCVWMTSGVYLHFRTARPCFRSWHVPFQHKRLSQCFAMLFGTTQLQHKRYFLYFLFFFAFPVSLLICTHAHRVNLGFWMTFSSPFYSGLTSNQLLPTMLRSVEYRPIAEACHVYAVLSAILSVEDSWQRKRVELVFKVCMTLDTMSLAFSY